MSLINRMEMGWPAHFIGADKCMFRRNTLLTAGTQCFIVSTVGNYRPHEDSEMTKIGALRYYETMVFKAKKMRKLPYYEAVIEKEVTIEEVSTCLGCVNEWSDLEANIMHKRVVYVMMGRMSPYLI